MPVPANAFKRGLREGIPQIGLWSCLGDPGAAELLAGVGFDWLLIDCEHTPNDVRSLTAQLRAAERGTSVVARPPQGDEVWIKQFLDVGVQTLLIPMVDDAEYARMLARAVEFPPLGTRGVATQTRAGRWGAVPDHLHTARDELFLIVQIESVRALGHVDEIAAVEGVDALFVGPADLSASMGHLGRPGAEEVQRAIARIAQRAHAAGKPVGVLTVDETQAHRHLEDGFDFVAVGMDTHLLRRAASELRGRFRPLTRADEPSRTKESA